jgi:hypothetical protein
MIFNSGLLKGMLRSIIWGCLPAMTAFSQMVSHDSPMIAPVPPDPLELAAGQIQSANTPAGREAALQLLSRARNQFALRSTGQAYDLKVSFAVDSAGKTNYDGAWQMEDLFAPRQGHRWTAAAASGYAVTAIATAGKIYGDEASSAVPLRLLEARGVLFDPLQSPAYADKGSIRTFTTTFRGASVTCLLLSRSRNPVRPASGRDWEEAEECIDPQSGLLQMHSEVPGRYAVYDYSNAPELAGHILPRTVTIMEAGRMVSKVTVESLGELSAPDPGRFVPSDEMKARGEAVAMTSATKVTRVHGEGPFTPAMTLRAVCVFGIVTATGHLVEAHSLQPSDPNSQAAVEDAMKIDFSPLTPAGAPPRQHFAFVIEKFIAPQQAQ